MYTFFTLFTLAASHAASVWAAPSAAEAAATKYCIAPKAPRNRPQCGSAGSDSFLLQLAYCQHQKTDGLYLIPTTNTTTNTANVYTSAPPPQTADQYEYPPGFSAGPWAWRALFAFPTTDSAAPTGLSAVTFEGGSGNEYSCDLTGDGAKFQCGGVANWYVHLKDGQLFTSGSTVKAKGYQKVVPYIFQGCASS